MRVKIFIILIICLLGQELFAQCYQRLRQEGITLYYTGISIEKSTEKRTEKLKEAKRVFEVASQRCKDIPANNDLEKWIDKCTNPPPPKPPTTEPSSSTSSANTVIDRECEQECYLSPLEFAIVTYNSENYISALEIFLRITECPCIPQINELSSWIERCNQMIGKENCIETCYSMHYKNGERFLEKELFKEAEEEFLKANLCDCVPEGSDVTAKMEYSREMLIWNTLRRDSISFTLWNTQAYYTGDVQYGTANGEGECVFFNHPFFRSVKAIFSEGLPTGNIELFFINGEKYVGHFEDNQLHSQGNYIYPNGDIYQGEYADYMPNGTGEMRYENGDHYQGEFKKGEREGQGKLTAFNRYIDNADKCKIYEGSWKSDMKMGEGKCYDTAGKLIHDGIFKNDFPEQNYPNRVLKVPIDFVEIEGGTYRRGCDYDSPGCTVNERPAHDVTVSDFAIGKYEVTVALYREFCKETGHPMPSPPAWGWVDEHPMVNVSWYDATAFCEWNNCRLPTEAEWEYAAKGGSQSKGYLYSGGDLPGNVAVLDFNGKNRVLLVGKKQPNELGIYDMSGNVAEWCQDYFGTYFPTPQENPAGADRGTTRVLRGGSWATSEKECRVIIRSHIQPNYNTSSIGFRVVKL